MKTYTINTNGICAMQISFSLDKGKIYNVQFVGGCPGNTVAIGKLLEGIASATFILKGGYKVLTHDDIINILKESMEY